MARAERGIAGTSALAGSGILDAIKLHGRDKEVARLTPPGSLSQSSVVYSCPASQMYRHDNTPKHQLARAVPRQFAPASVTKDQLTLETDRVNFPSHCHIVMLIRIVALAGWTLMAEVSTLSEHGRQLPGWRSFP